MPKNSTASAISNWDKAQRILCEHCLPRVRVPSVGICRYMRGSCLVSRPISRGGPILLHPSEKAPSSLIPGSAFTSEYRGGESQKRREIGNWERDRVIERAGGRVGGRKGGRLHRAGFRIVPTVRSLIPFRAWNRFGRRRNLYKEAGDYRSRPSGRCRG